METGGCIQYKKHLVYTYHSPTSCLYSIHFLPFFFLFSPLFCRHNSIWLDVLFTRQTTDSKRLTCWHYSSFILQDRGRHRQKYINNHQRNHHWKHHLSSQLLFKQTQVRGWPSLFLSRSSCKLDWPFLLQSLSSPIRERAYGTQHSNKFVVLPCLVDTYNWLLLPTIISLAFARKCFLAKKTFPVQGWVSHVNYSTGKCVYVYIRWRQIIRNTGTAVVCYTVPHG